MAPQNRHLRGVQPSYQKMPARSSHPVCGSNPLRAPGSNNADPQVAMSINYIAPDLYVKDSHRRDVKSGHFIAREEAESQVQAAETSVRVRVQLQTAPNDDAAYAIIRDAFMAHLERMLHMAEDQTIDESVALVEQGVDSLVAVDIRAWFLRELQADIPTLKVMGGGSVSVLVKTALAKMPAQQDVGATEVITPAKNRFSRCLIIPHVDFIV